MNYPVPVNCNNNAAAQEAAEAYALNRLSERDHERYEEHLLICSRCQDAVDEFEAFFAAIRSALSEPPMERKQRRAAKPRTKSANC